MFNIGIIFWLIMFVIVVNCYWGLVICRGKMRLKKFSRVMRMKIMLNNFNVRVVKVGMFINFRE